MEDKETYAVGITCFNCWADMVVDVPFGLRAASFIAEEKCHNCGCKLDSRGINKKRI